MEWIRKMFCKMNIHMQPKAFIWHESISDIRSDSVCECGSVEIQKTINKPYKPPYRKSRR